MEKIKQRIIAMVVIFLIIFTSHAIAEVPAHLQWIGFLEDFTGFEPRIQQDMANHSGRIRNLNLLNDSVGKGMAGFVEVGNVFCLDGVSGGTWTGLELRSDYEQCWKAFKDLIEPLVESGHIKGFAIGDEPVWRGMSISELTTIADTIKDDFNDSIVFVVEAKGPIVDGINCFYDTTRPDSNHTVDYDPIPANIDWIGFDEYREASNVKSNYETYLYPKMSSSQKAIIIPPSFGSDGNPVKTAVQYDTERASAAYDFYTWAVNDSNIIGIFPWHLKTMTYDVNYLWEQGKYWEIGAVDMPQTRAAWQTIGAEIIAGNSQNVLAHASFIQKFDSFSNNEQLPSIYKKNPWDINGMDTANISFSTAQAYSGTTSIFMKNNAAKFRYCWGTNDRSTSDSRRWIGQNAQYIEFKIYISNESTSDIKIFPYLLWDTPCYFRINNTGITYKTTGDYELIADMNSFNNLAWNKVKIKIDMNSIEDVNDNILTVWINDVKCIETNFSSKEEVFFDSVVFERYGSSNIYIDDIGMWGDVEPVGEASNPLPTDGQANVSLNADLTWTAGQMADSHNIYFSTNYNSVLNASNPNTLPGRGNQTARTYNLDRLEPDTTYYWAIDEVNDSSIWHGEVWSFTTELMIPPDTLIAAASSSYSGRDPNYAVNNAGITGLAHCKYPVNNKMWMTTSTSSNAWFKVNLGSSYNMDRMVIYNFNWEGYTDRGCKTIQVYYSNSSSDPGNPIDNPSSWTSIGNSFDLAEAPGTDNYGSTSEVDPCTLSLSGITARWISIKATSSHGANYKGLSEILFYYDIAEAKDSYPANNQIIVPTDANLSWVGDPHADSYNIYFGTTGPGTDTFQGNQTGTTFKPAVMSANTVYYWRVDTKTDTKTVKGDTWKFRTANTTVSATASSNYSSRDPMYAINGAGMIALAHCKYPVNNTMWMTTSSSSNAWFKVNLGSSYNMTQMVIYNFNWEGYTDRGCKTIQVYYSNSSSDPGNPIDNPSNWTSIGNSFDIAEAPGTDNYGTSNAVDPCTLSLSGITARWISIKATSSHGANYKGLSEVLFYSN